MDRSGIPPTPPPAVQNASQQVFFSLDLLPPLIPTTFRKSSPTSSISDEKLHRRSASDIPLGFPLDPMKMKMKMKMNPSFDREEKTEEIFDAFLNFDGFREEIDCRVKNGACSSESEGESNAIESVHSAAHSRHFRSISMDGLMGKLNFGEDSARVLPSPGSKRSQISDGEFSLEFGNGEFSAAELKKIMADKRLEEVALADPKRAKRVLANRQSAARSKERKMRYISELERRVQTLQTEATTLSTQLTFLQRDSSGLVTENNELKIRLQSMEQQAQLRDALNEALTTEVQRLRLATTRMDDSLPKQIKTARSIKS